MDEKQLTSDVRRVVEETDYGTTNIEEYEADIIELAIEADMTGEPDSDRVHGHASFETDGVEAIFSWTSPTVSHDGYVGTFGYLTIEGHVDGEYYIFELEDVEAPSRDIIEQCDKLPKQIRDARRERRQARQEYRNMVL